MKYPTRGRGAPECQSGSSDSLASIRSSSWRQFPKLWFLLAEVGGSLRSVLAKHLRYLTRSGSLSSTTLLDSIVESLARPVGSETISRRAASFGRPYWRFARWIAGGVDGGVGEITVAIVDSDKAGSDRIEAEEINSRGNCGPLRRKGSRSSCTSIYLAFLWRRRGLNRVWPTPEHHAPRVTCPFVCQIFA